MDESRRCTATSKQSGQRCKRAAIVGGTVCNIHGGKSPQVKAKAARRVAVAQAEAVVEREAGRLGGEVADADPVDQLMRLIRGATANVEVLRGLVAGLEATVSEVGIAGPTGSTAKLREAAPHVLVTMYDAERERLARWSKMAIEAGVQERRLELEAEQVRLAATAIREVAVAVLERAVAELGGAPVARDRLVAGLPDVIGPVLRRLDAVDVTEVA